MSTTVRIENNLEVEEVAGFLRALADVLEGGCADCLRPYGLQLHDFNKIKLGLRKGDTGELFLKIKVKDRPVSTGSVKVRAGSHKEEDPGRQEYKILKKRMKASFLAIGRSLKDGEKPQSGLIASFLADSRQMLTVPGYGDPLYEKYEACCSSLERAAAEGDVPRMNEAFSDLSSCMKSCHEQYK